MSRTYDLTRLDSLEINAASADVVEWNGRPALRLESGLALLKDLVAGDASVEVDLGADGGCYAGIAFRAADSADYELLYAQPHTSGLWDALQYDPVFRGTNTWQVFNGPRYQQTAEIPTGRWFTLRLDMAGARAVARVGAGAPLVVENLVHGRQVGRLGIWTFRPAYFGGLRIAEPDPALAGYAPARLEVEPGTVMAWTLEGVGQVTAEENGTVNLARFLAPLPGAEAVLSTALEAPAASEATLRFGFSDQLRLYLDGERIYEGEHTFKGFAVPGDRGARGYIEPGMAVVRVPLAAGRHVLSARVKATEPPFGWGLHLAVER